MTGPMHVTLLGPDDHRWTAALDVTPHDFYHLPAYARLCARHEDGEAAALMVEDGSASMLVPLVVRRVQGSIMDAESPYGYPGPLVSGTDEPAFVRAAFSAAIPVVAAHDIISMFVRFHPILNTVLPTGPGLVRHGDTVAIDLTQPIASQWSKIRRDHRVNLDRSVQLGHRAYVDTKWDHYEGFKSLYRSTMARLEASSFYDFGDEYFDGLREALGTHLGLAVVVIDGELAAASLISEFEGIVQYHLTGWDIRFRQYQPTKRLIHFVQTWATECGHRWFHLGGGLGGPDDRLLLFKSGFSDVRFPFHTYRVISDASAYDRLTALLAPSSDPGDLSGFFPLYRGTPGLLSTPR